MTRYVVFDFRFETVSNAIKWQATLFYHACIVYLHTSMWTGQRVKSLRMETNLEISTSVQIIFTECEQILAQRDATTNLGFMVFPLFIAACASTSTTEKIWVLQLLEPIASSA